MYSRKIANVGNLKDGTLIFDHNNVKQETLQHVICSRSSAGYYVDMNEMIGKRPVYTAYFNQCQVPNKIVPLPKEQQRDVSCKIPIWHNKCI